MDEKKETLSQQTEYERDRRKAAWETGRRLLLH